MQAAHRLERQRERQVLTGTTGAAPGLRIWQLFAICVVVWGTSWHVITWQLQSGTPELGVAMRFGLAGLLVLGLVFGRRRSALPQVGS